MSPEIIALILGIFFILVAIYKTVSGSIAKRRIANREAALKAGGTEESPVQLHNPFEAKAAAPTPAPAPTPESAPSSTPKPKEKDHKDSGPYLWE